MGRENCVKVEELAARGVEHRIEIAASPEEVWRPIEAIGEWGRWNPLYIAASGVARVGETIDFTVALEGMKPQKGRAVVRSVEPGRSLQYQTSDLGGLVRATRYIVLEPRDEGRTVVANGEFMEGLVGRLLGRLIGGKVLAGLTGMNHALKTLVERT